MLTGTSGVKLVDSLDVMSWYTGKIEVAGYLENLNSEEKVGRQTFIRFAKDILTFY